VAAACAFLVTFCGMLAAQEAHLELHKAPEPGTTLPKLGGVAGGSNVTSNDDDAGDDVYNFYQMGN